MPNGEVGGGEMSEEAKIQFHGKPGIMPQDLCRAKNIHVEAKVIFALLTTYKEAWPGQQWLGDHVPCSGPTVRSRLRELELHGWLLRVRRNRRMNETDLYHIYLSKPLPVLKRAKWVQELGLTALEITSLPKGDYSNEITVMRLLKRAFDKKVEGSEVLKSSEVKTPQTSADEPRPDGSYPANWYRQNEKDYQEIKGVSLSGPEFGEIQRTLKTIYKAGHTPEDVRALMEAFEASKEEWTDSWTMHTVARKMPEFLAGKLFGDNRELLSDPKTTALKEDIYQVDRAIMAIQRKLDAYVLIEDGTRQHQPRGLTIDEEEKRTQLRDTLTKKEEERARLVSELKKQEVDGD